MNRIWLNAVRAGVSFSPPDIAGLQLWHDATDITTLWQDDGRTTQVASDADPVGAWDDKSGNDLHVLQATAGARPTYKTGIQNGLPVIRADGGDLLRTSTGSVVSQPYTVFIVGVDTLNSVNYFFDARAGNSRAIISENGSGSWRFFAGSTLSDGAADTNWHIFAGVANGGSSSIIVDGSRTNGNAGSSSFDLITLFASRADGNNLTGDIGEVIVYDSALSDADINTVAGYLTRWGVSWSDL